MSSKKDNTAKVIHMVKQNDSGEKTAPVAAPVAVVSVPTPAPALTPAASAAVEEAAKVEKRDAKKLMESYDVFEAEFDALEARKLVLNKEKSKIVKEIMDLRGKEPFTHRGVKMTPCKRDNTYYFRSPKDVKDIDEL